MSTLLKDTRYAARVLLKSPGFALIAFATLALGIGANTAIFSLVNTVLLRPLPVKEPGRLVSVSVSGKDDSVLAFSYPTYQDFRDRNQALSGLVAERLAPMSLSRDGNNQRVWGYLVTGNYFDVLGVRAARGRTFTPEEAVAPLANPVAVLSYGCWQRRFGADPNVVGQNVLLNGHEFEVIGVMPEKFAGTAVIYTPEVWLPVTMQEWIEPGSHWLERRSTQNIFAVGRLKDGVTREQAEASLNLLAQQLGKEYPDTEEGKHIRLVPPGFIIPQLRGAFIGFAAVLMATVGLVLLIACTNLANLLLARAAARRKEIAIRLALGASRRRVVRQLLVESLLLSLAGGAAGLLLAVWILDLVAAYRPPIEIPVWIELTMDWRVLAFTLAASVVTSLLFGLAPALQATRRTDLVPALKDAASQAGPVRARLRGALVVAQVTLSLVLLVAAGLVVRALARLQTANPGFEVGSGLVMSFDVALQGYDEARGREFERQVVERVRALPGVRDASLTDLLPLSLNYDSSDFYVEGQPPTRAANAPVSMVASVEPHYFKTMGVPLVAGRGFTEADDERAPRVVVVNEMLARRFFPGANPAAEAVGRRISFSGAEGPWMQIVGVAADGKYWTIGEAPQFFVYSPLAQSYSSTVTLVARTERDPRALVGAIRGEVQKLDPNLPLYDVKTMEEHLGVSLFPARVAAALLSGFGVLALLLAAMGIYGVVSYSAAQRTREIGIRMALGAQGRDVLRLVAGRGMLLVAAGVLAGLACAFALTRFMEGVLYGVSATDPLTFALVALLLALVALVACYVPARRATKVDPMVALRYE